MKEFPMANEIPDGYCKCGCGERTNRYIQTRPKKGIVKGEFQKYIHGHNSRGTTNPNWRGGKFKRKDGYINLSVGNSKRRLEHVVIYEKNYGSSLPKGSVIHHKNEDKSDNRLENLMLCKDIAHHREIHKKLNALKACGHENYTKCAFCKKYDDPSTMFHSTYGQHYHSECRNIYQLKHRHKKGISHAYHKISC